MDLKSKVYILIIFDLLNLIFELTKIYQILKNSTYQNLNIK